MYVTVVGFLLIQQQLFSRLFPAISYNFYINLIITINLTGVKDVWDEYKKEHVTIKAIFIATITDLPGRGCLSGEKTKGYTGCVECLDETDAIHLSENKKMVYTGHRRFLRKDQPYRRNRKDFNGTTEKRGPSKYRDRKQILKQVSKLTYVVLGKGEGAVPAPAGSIWKKKSIF